MKWVSAAPLIFVSAFLLILSFPPFDCGWLAWVALVPWLATLEAPSTSPFLCSYLVGLFFFVGTLWWVAYVTVPGMILLVAALAFYYGIWGWAAHRVIASGAKQSPHQVIASLLALPAAWALLEYVRMIFLTGLGWNLLAHTQWRWIPIIQIADVTGVTGVSFLVVLVNTGLWMALWGKRQKMEMRGLRVLLLTALCLLAIFAYGSIRLRQFDQPSFPSSPYIPSFKVAVLQGNISQTEKWDESFAEAIWKRYEELTLKAAKESPDLIVWPETAVPGFLSEPDVYRRISWMPRMVRTPMLVGVPTSNDENQIFNTAILLESDGKILQRYDKIHLVPFGEYLPLAPVLGWLRRLVLMGNFSPGQAWSIFHPTSMAYHKGVDFAVLICFEDLFPGLCRRFIHEGARAFIVITNDAWFHRSPGSVQHLQASVMRAVENRVSVARAANTGWSGFVRPTGEVLPSPHQTPLFKPGFAVGTLEAPGEKSFYSRHGDWFQVLCLALVGLAFLPVRKPI